ncbi:hypothetical protein QP162_18255 [Sphingomonas aurantiaca]|uniref:hypothetical protein n=1 Tax=Sphingomonas aurantiaca TaxID=185949 RepID=UPI002FE3AB38
MTPLDGDFTDTRYDTGIDAILITAEAAPDRFAAALAAVGGRIVARIGWQAPFGLHAAPQLVVVEAAGVDAAVLADHLPRIVARAAVLEAALVVAMDDDQIDAVAAATLGGGTTLLVDPGVADCVAAIVVAAERTRSPAGVFDAGRETDGMRLERLNTEVARIAEALARLTRAEFAGDAPAAPIVGDRTNRYGAQPSLATPSAADVRRAIRARRLRDQFFGTALFEDPGWDMLLDLYAAEPRTGARLGVEPVHRRRGRADDGVALDRADDRHGAVRTPPRHARPAARVHGALRARERGDAGLYPGHDGGESADSVTAPALLACPGRRALASHLHPRGGD